MPTTNDTEAPKPQDAIAADLAALKRDFASLLSTLKATQPAQAKEAVQHAAEQLTGKAADIYGQATAQAGRGAKVLAQEIEERPLTTLLLAFSIGFIASRLLSR